MITLELRLRSNQRRIKRAFRLRFLLGFGCGGNQIGRGRFDFFLVMRTYQVRGLLILFGSIENGSFGKLPRIITFGDKGSQTMANIGYCRIIVEALSILLFRMDDSGTFPVMLFRRAVR